MKSILICSPGRCGSHWVCDVLRWYFGLKKQPTYRRGDTTLFDLELASPGGRIHLTHDSPSYWGDALDLVTILLVVRDPRDVAISAAYYWVMKRDTVDREKLKRFWGIEPPIDYTLEQTLTLLKRIGHNPTWWDDFHRSHNFDLPRWDLCYWTVRYEDLPSYFPTLVRLLAPTEQIDGPALAAAFQRQYEKAFLSKGRTQGDHDPNDFYRRGIVGEWKEHFSALELAGFKARFGPVMELLGYE